MVINTETHSQSTCWELEIIKSSTLNGSLISQPLPPRLRIHQWKGNVEVVRARGSEDLQRNSMFWTWPYSNINGLTATSNAWSRYVKNEDSQKNWKRKFSTLGICASRGYPCSHWWSHFRSLYKRPQVRINHWRKEIQIWLCFNVCWCISHLVLQLILPNEFLLYKDRNFW